MSKLVTKIKIMLGIPVKMIGRDFIELNRSVFIKNGNLDTQIEFLKRNDCYYKEGKFVLCGGSVGIEFQKNVLKITDGGEYDLSKHSMILGSPNAGQVYNPLKQLLTNTELLLMRENISANLSNDMLHNPHTLYKGLIESSKELSLIETEHFEILGNNLLEIKMKKRIDGDFSSFSREEEIVKEVVKVLKDILAIQVELN